MQPLSVETLGLLALAAFVAAIFDAIAGGGGLLTVPALLAAGIDPLRALATNKLQGSFATLSSARHFVSRGHVDLRAMRMTMACTSAGAVAGTLSAQHVSSVMLARILPWMLIGMALYFLLSSRVSDEEAHRRIDPLPFALVVGTGVGFYDGFFGPGAGSFFTLAGVALLGMGIRKAIAQARVLNFVSTATALVFFAAGGNVIWQVGIAMGIASMLGARLGSQLVLRWGVGVARPLIVIICIALSVKLLAYP